MCYHNCFLKLRKISFYLKHKDFSCGLPMFVSETLHPLCRQPFNNLLVGFDIEFSSNISFQEYYQLFSFSHLSSCV